MNPNPSPKGAVLRLAAAALVCLLSACGGLVFLLPEHSVEHMSVPLSLHVGERLPALSTPSHVPAGGFELGLASEDPDVVSVEVSRHGMGATDTAIVARMPGVVRVHYVNRYALPRDPSVRASRDQILAASQGSFQVTVK